MKLLVIIFSIGLILMSCGGNSTQPKINDESFETEVTSDSLSHDSLTPPQENESGFLALSTKTQDVFRQLYAPEIIQKLDDYLNEYNSISNAKEFEVYYQKGNAIFELMRTQIDSAKTSFLQEMKEDHKKTYGYFSPVDGCLDLLQDINGEFGPVYFTCASECTELEFNFDNTVLLEKSASTPNMADDEFIGMVNFIYGEYWCTSSGGWPVWYEQTWDYGGASLLGDDSFTEAMKEVKNYQKSHCSFFKKEIAGIKEHMLNELSYPFAYMHSREKVLKEYDVILKDDFFSSTEKEKIKAAYEKIQHETEGIQFDCKTGDCSYG